MKKMIVRTIIAILLVSIGYLVFTTFQAAGRRARGERMERIKASPRYIDGEFRNMEETPAITGSKDAMRQLRQKVENLVPERNVPVVKTDLHALDRSEEVVLWLGHSTVFIQSGGVRYLFDPVLTSKFPVKVFMKPFLGTDAYTPEDIPEVDYLIVTHDHWDHLDRPTVRAIRSRVGRVVCALGIGQYFEDWGYPVEKIDELEWGDSVRINATTVLRCLPSRHFSGRLLRRNQTLWASYLIDGQRRIFVSGDGGYDSRFEQFGMDYPGIDLAIMENGQYNENWKYIHTMPDLLPKAIDELGPARVMTYHNSKFALARHPWTEPLDRILENSKGKPWRLLLPRIGEVVELDGSQEFVKWW